MTLWKDEQALNDFYRNGKHLEAMKQSKVFSSNIKSIRVDREDVLPWKEAKQRVNNS